MPEWVIITTPFLYLGLLFAIAYVADKRADTGGSLVNNPYVYTLSIAVYCTAWTFYGSVGRAAEAGMSFLTIYLGPTLMAILWWLVLRKMIRIAKQQRITSIADLIASRYGKSMLLGGLATFIAVVGITPYIALQLKAVSASFDVLLTFPEGPAAGVATTGLVGDKAFWVASVLAVFAILFGTRNIDATERLEGMVVAVAFESIVKLIAFLAVGVFVTFMVFDGPGEILRTVAAQEDLRELLDLRAAPGGYASWLGLTLLSMAAIMFLPRQFQVTVVENVNEDHLRTAAWLFPLYLLLMNLFVLPIALAGLLYFGDTTAVDSDNYVLALPLAEGNELLALFVYLGGFSAATGMVIVATIALAIMVSNDLVMPALLRMRHLPMIERIGLRRLIIYLRRIIIGGIVLLGYAYFRLIAETYALVSIGLISFVAIAQFAPAILLGMYWKGASRPGAITGLVAGGVVWLYTLFLPSLADPGWLPATPLENGPFGIELLHPYALFGLTDLDPITHALFWSMLANIGGLVGVSLFTRQSDIERIQAALFVDVFLRSEQDSRFWQGNATIGDVEALLARFIGDERAAEALAPYLPAPGDPREAASRQAPPELVNHVERLLSGTIGSASARVMVSSIVKGEALTFEGVMEILDATSRAIEYGQRLEQKSRQLEQATSELRAANERLKELDQLKDEFVSMVSHELRTPLTSIRAFGEILLSDPDMDARQRSEFLEVVVRESERLTRLINQVLDLSKIESGWSEWHLETLDLRTVIREGASSTSQLFTDRGLHLDLRLPDTPCPVKGDSDRLVQLVINLLSNAVKFSDPDAGPVVVELATRGSLQEMWVTDSGPGIPEGERERIFEKFHQITDQQAGKPKGSGLGLAICKRISDLHWGTIHVENSDDAGARFVVRLPEAGGEHCDVG